jgi:nicotinamidase-related amidase
MSGKEDNVRIILDPTLTVLVIVDMENEFCTPGGKLYHPEGTDEVIPKLKELLGQCRHIGTRIIFVQSTRFEHSPEFARFGQKPIILKGTWGSKFIEGINPEGGEPTIEKHTHDCFYKTEMDNLLEKLGIMPETHSIIIGGINANICVYHAVLGFHIRHYRVLLPMDCCAGRPEGRRMLEKQMSDPAYSYNVRVTQSELIVFNK